MFDDSCLLHHSHFSEGYGLTGDTDKMTNQHALFLFVSIFDVSDLDLSANNVVDEVKKYIAFSWEIFTQFTNSRHVYWKLYLERNYMFNLELVNDFKRQWMRPFILAMEKLRFSGWNIFEECFIHKSDDEAKVEIFVRLMDAFFNSMNKNWKNLKKTAKEQRGSMVHDKSGELYRLYEATNGFHVWGRVEGKKMTPLLFAVANGYKDVIEFFIEHVIPESDSKAREWAQNEEYMRSVLQAFLEEMEPDYIESKILDSFFELETVDLNYCSIPADSSTEIGIGTKQRYASYVGHEILRLRSLRGMGGENKKIMQRKPLLLEVLSKLFEIEYDFANNKDEFGQNILHYAIRLGDREAIDLIIEELNESASDTNTDLKTILNDENKEGYVPLALALFGMDDKVAESLLRCPEQSYAWIEDTRNNPKWLQCLYNVMIRTKMEILDAMEPTVIAMLLKFSSDLLEDKSHHLGAREKENEYKSHARHFKLWRALVEALREYSLARGIIHGTGTHQRNKQNMVM